MALNWQSVDGWKRGRRFVGQASSKGAVVVVVVRGEGGDGGVPTP